MKKIVRLTETDLIRIVNRVLNEQTPIKSIPKLPIQGSGNKKLPHPTKTPFWGQLRGNVEGDLVETLEYIPNKKLIINAAGPIYTIIKKGGNNVQNSNISNQKILPHPIELPFYNTMIRDVENKLSKTLEYIPNKKLVIDASGVIYTIILK